MAAPVSVANTGKVCMSFLASVGMAVQTSYVRDPFVLLEHMAIHPEGDISMQNTLYIGQRGTQAQ